MFNPEQQRTANGEGPPLRVALALTSSLITVAARENVRFSTTEGILGRSGNSTIRWGDSLAYRPKQEVAEEPALRLSENNPPLLEPKKVVPPSLATFERAVSAGIYFEKSHFSLLRQPPSREQ